MRQLLCILLLFTLAPLLSAEHMIITGGPSLRKWEDLRVAPDRHDRWWANFIRASTLRMVEIRKAYGENASIYWIVYRPAYILRGQEDGKPYVTWITDLAKKRNVTLRWISSGNDMINAMNSRRRGSVITFDYFGHSNKYCYMLDYSADVSGASTAWVHEDEFHRIKSSIFARNAYCKSWGCHTAESMSQAWKRHFKVPLEGAIGSTDYSVVGHGHMPAIVGRWGR